MVELQLEKLSPLPVAQIVWTIHVLPARRRRAPTVRRQGVAATPMQTIIVIIAGRAAVEEFLGKLEERGLSGRPARSADAGSIGGRARERRTARGFMPGRGGKDAALVAWRSDGALRNLCLLVLPPDGDRAKSLKDQLAQLCWAGEMEGWLTEPPRWHLVADPVNAAEWEKLLRDGAERAGAGDRSRRRRRNWPRAPRAGPRVAAGRGAAARGIFRALSPAVCGPPLAARAECGGHFVCDWRGDLFLRDRRPCHPDRQGGAAGGAMGGSYTNVLQLKARYDGAHGTAEVEICGAGLLEDRRRETARRHHTATLSFADGQKLTLNGVCAPDQVE